MSTTHHLSEDERLLSEAAHAFANSTRRKASRAEKDWRGDWRELAKLGWLGVLTSVDEGGFGGSNTDLLLLSTALGFGQIHSPFLSTVALTTPLLALTNADQRARWLPEVVTGERRLALAHQESPGDPAAHDLNSRAVQRDGGYILDGAKQMVLYGTGADALIVSACVPSPKTNAAVGVFLVSPSAPGVSTVPYKLIDGSEAADFFFNGVILEDNARLDGTATDASKALDDVMLLATLGAIGWSIGCLEAALASTVEHLQTRRQFDKPLASFQVLRHRVADMYIALEELRSLAFIAARMPDGPARTAAIRAAKIHLGISGIWAAEQAVQLHGAMGVTDECKVGQLLKALTVTDRLFGGADHHIAQLGTVLLKVDAS